jgi:hypothetical protein
MTKERRTFSSEFKLQVVRLYENGKLKNLNLTISILIEFVQLSVDDSLTHHEYVRNFDRSLLLLYVLRNDLNHFIYSISDLRNLIKDNALFHNYISQETKKFQTSLNPSIAHFLKHKAITMNDQNSLRTHDEEGVVLY